MYKVHFLIVHPLAIAFAGQHLNAVNNQTYKCFMFFLKNTVSLFMFWFKSDETDVSQFDSKFTKQTPVDSPDDATLSESANQVFYVCASFGAFQHI